VRGGERVQKEGEVWKEGRGCGRREEDVRGEIRMWEGRGEVRGGESVGRVWNKGGGCDRGRKGKSEKEGESVEGGGEYGMRAEDGRGGMGK